MSPRERAVTGLVGALLFLVLAQGYRLVAGDGPGLPALLVVAAVVWAATAALAGRLDRLLAKRRV